MFSKTATNNFLAASHQMSGYEPSGQLVSNILDSQASSPTMKSDIALRTTAQFTHMQFPANLNVLADHQDAVIQSQGQGMQPQVLAASGPQGQHIKSQSTSNQNYFSNLNSGGAHGGQVEYSAATVQGRATETGSKKAAGQLSSHGGGSGLQGLSN